MQTITPHPISTNKLRRAYLATWAMFALCDVRDLAGRVGIDIIGPVGTVQTALGRWAGQITGTQPKK